jgi:hypothetical protein
MRQPFFEHRILDPQLVAFLGQRQDAQEATERHNEAQ